MTGSYPSHSPQRMMNYGTDYSGGWFRLTQGEAGMKRDWSIIVTQYRVCGITAIEPTKLTDFNGWTWWYEACICGFINSPGIILRFELLLLCLLLNKSFP